MPRGRRRGGSDKALMLSRAGTPPLILPIVSRARSWVLDHAAPLDVPVATVLQPIGRASAPGPGGTAGQTGAAGQGDAESQIEHEEHRADPDLKGQCRRYYLRCLESAGLSPRRRPGQLSDRQHRRLPPGVRARLGRGASASRLETRPSGVPVAPKGWRRTTFAE